MVNRRIIKIGNFSKTGHHGKNVYHWGGVAPTLISGIYKNGLNILITDGTDLNNDYRDDEYRIMQKNNNINNGKLKYLSLFSGIGGFEVGLYNSKYGEYFENVGFSEIDKYAKSVYKRHFPEHKDLGDCSKIDTSDLDDFDLLVGGFPCFTGDMLVYTIDGFKPIKDVVKGEYVLTHTNTFKKVINVMFKPYHDKGVQLTYNHNNTTIMTPEHPVYIYNTDTGLYEFIHARDLKVDSHELVIPKQLIDHYLKEHEYLKITHETREYFHTSITKIEEININEGVYNLEVETDNTYTINGLTVHNCQAFSVAGKRKGFEDTRGTLFFEIARILRDKRPRYFLLENVKGLLSHNKGETFQTILTVLSDLGYYVKWELHNSKNYGVPQNRERVFIKGYLRSECGPEILLETRNRRKNTKKLTDNRELNTYRDSKRCFSIYDNGDTLSRTITSSGQNSRYNNLIREISDNDRELKKLGNVFNGGQAGNVYDEDGLSCTLSANGGGAGGRTGLYKVEDERNIIKEDIKYPVTRRKYNVDTDALKELLSDSKKSSGYTNKEISDKLNVPFSMVEHWFRNDEYFSIPSPEIWSNLKELLNITDDSFDEQITVFETVLGEYDQRNRLYNTEGISPTLSCKDEYLIKDYNVNGKVVDGKFVPTTQDGDFFAVTTGNRQSPLVKRQDNYVLEDDNRRIQKVGNTNNHQSGDVYSPDGLGRTLCCTDYKAPMKIVEDVDLCIGSTQKHATRTNGDYSPTLTEAMGTGGGHVPMVNYTTNDDGMDKSVMLANRNSNGRHVKDESDPSFTLSTSPDNGVTDGFRIRRLTPLECERLQAFEDFWTMYGKDDELISDTQRYKMCGNAVTTSVISYLIDNMFCWDDFTE